MTYDGELCAVLDASNFYKFIYYQYNFFPMYFARSFPPSFSARYCSSYVYDGWNKQNDDDGTPLTPPNMEGMEAKHRYKHADRQ